MNHNELVRKSRHSIEKTVVNFRLTLLCVGLLSLASIGQSDEVALPPLQKFSSWISGLWDNQQQVLEDEQSGVAEFDRHLHYGMNYIALQAPKLRGQLFAIQSYNEDGFNGPMSRVALHRFFTSAEGDEIVHEFLFLLDKDRWGDLTMDLSSLEELSEADVRINPQCRLYWRWMGDHFEGRTRPGECITSSYTETPILVEGHGLLYQDRLLRHDLNYQLSGEIIHRQGGATEEIFLRPKPRPEPEQL